ncbi:MAG: DUF4430 domain-containing protein [Candidatus Zixiibacteriota bacterium]
MYKIVLISFLVLLLATCFGCADKKEKSDSNANSEPFDSLIVDLVGRDSISVFDLLREEHQVDFIESAVGNFVHAVDSVSINQNFGWMYSVNDTMGTVASDKYITKDGDVVKWHYRKF